MNELERRLNQPLLKRIISLLPPEVTVYLVGGAVRDVFLDRESYDLDFVTGTEAMRIARKMGDDLGAAYFPLDTERKVARLVLRRDDQSELERSHPYRVDFSAYQGPDLEADLRGRDFTINAMAVDIHQLDRLVDPTNGAADLAAKRLRACSDSSLQQDPIRVMRGVRFSVGLGLKILPETLGWMREATPKLHVVSNERIRDELFRMLSIAHPGRSMRIMDNLGALDYILPELVMLKAVDQSAPHIWDAYNHTLDLLDRLEGVLDALRTDYDPDKTDNLSMGLLVMKLGRYRQQLAGHLANSLNPERSVRGLLFLAGLYHDAGKQATRKIDGEGNIRFIGHEEISAKLLKDRSEELKLSNLEIDRLVMIVNNHMRPSTLSHTDMLPSRKAVYHFFRDTGAAGVDVCLLSLADMLATYGPTLPPERWARHLDVVRTLLSAWWEERDEHVFPAALVNGNELMMELGISTGPVVGFLLEAIREAQVANEVQDKGEALELAQQKLKEYKENEPADKADPL